MVIKITVREHDPISKKKIFGKFWGIDYLCGDERFGI
jgi:hypothetical protein